MSGIKTLLMVASMASTASASAEEHGRIKRPPPTPTEAERIASDIAMNDGLLQKGDIVVTDRGFFVFRGVGADGYTYDFSEVPNPLPSAKK
jgi:hypothetical protein